jgi:hypothetical protein
MYFAVEKKKKTKKKHFIHCYYCIYCPWQPLTYLYFPYCISLIYFSFTEIRMFLYAQIYWLAEFGDVSCLQFNYLRVETLTPTWEDFVGQFGRTILRVKSDKTLCPTWEYDRWYTWRDLYLLIMWNLYLI